MQVRLNVEMARPIETLAQRLKLARTSRGLTQTALAERAEMNQSDVSKIERGEVQKTTSLTRLARELGVDPWWLETGEGDSPDWIGEPQPVAVPPTAKDELAAETPAHIEAAMKEVDWHTLALQMAMDHPEEAYIPILLDFLERVRKRRAVVLQAIAERAKKHTPTGAKG